MDRQIRRQVEDHQSKCQHFQGESGKRRQRARAYGGMGCKGLMSRERGKMAFPGPFRESFSANPSLSFLLGVVLPRSGHLPALGRNSVEELNGCGAVIGSETLSLLL